MFRVILLNFFGRLGRPANPNPEQSQEALTRLYQEQAGGVYRYFRARVQPGAEAEDLTSLVFRKAVESWPNFRPQAGQTATGWLFGIAHHVLADYFRQKSRSGYASSSLEDNTELELEDPGPEALALLNEQAYMLRRAVQELPVLQPEVLTFKFTAQLSYSEIAQATGRKEAAIRMLAHRGLENLRQKLSAETTPERANR